MTTRLAALWICVLTVASSFAASAEAQPLGTFRWQLTPYCNVLTLAVTQSGDQYRFEGTDDQCGAATRAPVIGLGVPNPDATLEFGLTIVTPAGPTHVDVKFTVAALGGTWRDSQGATGTLVFNPPSPATGSPRPAPVVQIADGAITTGKLAVGAVDTSRLADAAVNGAKVLDGSLGASDINTTEVQRRVSGTCATGQFLQSVNADGTVTCGTDQSSTGTITGVTAGTGLTGGGTSGAVTLNVDTSVVQSRVTGTCAAGSSIRVIAGDGTVTCELDNDSGGDITGVTPGTGLTGGATSGDATLSVAFAGTGAANTSARSDHTHAGNGSNNLVVGPQAGGALTTGAFNTAVGPQTLRQTTTGSRNIAVGFNTLDANTSGGDNVAIGSRVLSANTTAFYNVGVGSNVLPLLASGQHNIGIGYDALFSLTSGTGNIALGGNAGINITSGTDNIMLGNQGNAADDHVMRLGTTLAFGQGQSKTFIAGVRGVTTGVNDAVPVLIDSAGQLGTVSSSRRYKDDIHDLAPLTTRVQQLRPVQFRYKQPFADGSTPLQYGLIAEEVAEVMPELVVFNPAGEAETVKYHILPSLLLAEVQRLERERAQLEQRLQRLEHERRK